MLNKSKLNSSFDSSTLPEKVLQFGTGVLLRGLCDYFIDKANKQGARNFHLSLCNPHPIITYNSLIFPTHHNTNNLSYLICNIKK